VFYSNDQTFFNGSLYQKVNDKMEIGVNAGWKQGDPMPTFGLATQYKVLLAKCHA
jgi:hypothetical protein